MGNQQQQQNQQVQNVQPPPHQQQRVAPAPQAAQVPHVYTATPALVAPSSSTSLE